MNRILVSTLSLTLVALLATNFSACSKDKEEALAPKTDTPKEQVQAEPAVQSPEQAPAAAGDLKNIMVGLGGEMAILQGGLWTENFDLIAASAMKVADHPKVSDSEKERVMKALGPDFGSFVVFDKAVHGDAVRLSEAAKTKQWPAILKELSTLQGNCVSCHSQFRERLQKP